MEHFPQVPGSIRLDSDALGRMHTQPSQKASDRQRQQAISQGLSSTAISRGLIEAWIWPIGASPTRSTM